MNYDLSNFVDVYNRYVKHVDQCTKTIQEIEDELLQDLSSKLERNKILTNELNYVMQVEQVESQIEINQINAALNDTANKINEQTASLQANKYENQLIFKTSSINQNLKTDGQLNLIDSQINNFKSAETTVLVCHNVFG